MAKTAVLALKDYAVPTVPGAHYRLMCLTGPHKGEAFFLRGDRIILGRGDKCDIKLLDSNVSREHAELKKFGPTYIITDLGSQNGVFVNDLKTVQHTLVVGDRLVICSTVFKFDRVEVNEPNNIEVFNEKKEEETNTDELPPKKRKIIGLISILIVFYLLLDDSGSGKKQKRKRVNITTSRTKGDEFSQALRKKQQIEEKEVKENIEAIFHKGLREYREKNYFRAIEEFNLALIYSPKNQAAIYYLERTKQTLDKEIEESFIRARRETEALRYRNAIVTYCSIVRLLQNYPQDKRHLDASENIKTIVDRMGIELNEIECLQKQ